MDTHRSEIEQGRRFRFGGNWTAFLKALDEELILEAIRLLQTMPGRNSLQGLPCLDTGNGIVLFSLATHRLGTTMHSFDYDPASVAATTALRRSHGQPALPWHLEEAPVLDTHFNQFVAKDK